MVSEDAKVLGEKGFCDNSSTGEFDGVNLFVTDWYF